MKVVYTKSVWEKMHDAISEAARQSRQIEKFIISAEEWDELKCMAGSVGTLVNDDSANVTTFYGIPIEHP